MLRALTCAVTVVLLVCASAATPARAVMFALDGTRQLCFVEDVPQNIEYITGLYRRHPHTAYDGVTVKLELRTEANEPVAEHDLAVGEHSFSFAMQDAPSGSYLLCAYVLRSSMNWRAPNQVLYVQFSIDHLTAMPEPIADEFKQDDMKKRQVVDDMEVFEFTDYGGQRKSALQPRAYLQALERELLDIAITLTNVRSSALDTMQSSAQVRHTSESTFTCVWVCALFVIATLVATIYTQFGLLRRIIVHKKII